MPTEPTVAVIERLKSLSNYSEEQYWKLRSFLDSRPNLSEWVHGDDGPAFPFLTICARAKALAEALEIINADR